MEKICIFCGEKTERKTSEHIIPQWLIRLTGNPKRIAEFGYKDIDNPQLGKRTFSFDAFKFPSCESCNHKFAKLEEAVKPIVYKIINDDSLSAVELNTLLDWFDKIRIGLWLGFRYLDKDPKGVTPKFYIERRIGLNDRMLDIFKTANSKEGLNFIGTDMPSFYYTPSCFSLRINNYYFLNMSYNDLFSRRIGFPYPVESYMQEDGRLMCLFTKGRNRMMKPLLKKLFSIKGVELYQPMFFDRIHDSHSKNIYENKYVRDNSMSWEQGIGKVFLQDNEEIKEYPSYPSKTWIPSRNYPFNALAFEIQLLTLEWQIYINSLLPSPKMLSKEGKRRFMHNLSINNQFNKTIIEVLRKKAKELKINTLY